MRGHIFVGVTTKREKDPETLATTESIGWNGLAFADGTAPPDDALTDEIWSYGSAEGKKAVPEGSTAAVTDSGHRFLFVPNYCGEDAAGILLVQDISNLGSINQAARHDVNLYDLLGNYVGPGGTSAPAGPLGYEVDPGAYFAYFPEGDRRGNKIKSVVAVRVAEGLPDAGRLLLFVTVNLDPVDVFEEGCPPLDGTQTFDDGKYDYISITDITDMTAANSPPPGTWHYQDSDRWKQETKWLRLPPDLPAGFTHTICGGPDPGLPPGYDWSFVQVPHPSGGGIERPERIVGSGVLVAMAAHPAGTWVFVVSDDHGLGAWPGNPIIEDGGWHVPHLYAIDLSAGSFRDQGFLNDYGNPNLVPSGPHVIVRRFNKLIKSEFTGGAIGTTLIPSTIPGFPTSPGSVYPGEHHLELENRSRLVVIENQNLAVDPVRLYLGVNGEEQIGPDAADWELIGGVFSLAVDGDDHTNPVRYHSTIAVQRDAAGGTVRRFKTNGVAVLPPANAYLGDFPDRNVIAITGWDTTALFLGPQPRLFFVQEQ